MDINWYRVYYIHYSVIIYSIIRVRPLSAYQGALILDSCSNPAYALNQSLDFVRDLIGSTDATEYECRDGDRPLQRRHAAHKNVVAVVGGSYSSVTVQVRQRTRTLDL